jgi:hypothetical protein
MTGFQEPVYQEERWLSLADIKDYYKSVYPHWFSLASVRRRIDYSEVHEWCEDHWGGPSARRWSQSRSVWRVRDDSTWAYYLNEFYFKQATDCVLFQVRWR